MCSCHNFEEIKKKTYLNKDKVVNPEIINSLTEFPSYIEHNITSCVISGINMS